MTSLIETLRRVIAFGVPVGLSLQLAPAAAATIRVQSAEELQLVLTRARPGDIIDLAAGATFTGNFTLPKKEDGSDFITLRTGLTGIDAAMGRTTPDLAKPFAKLRSTNGSPVLQTAPGAHHWRIEFLELVGGGPGDAVALGDASPAQSSLDVVPHHLVVDHCYIHGDASTGVRRCVALNSASTTIANSYISDCKWIGEDAQAIEGWNGPGPFRIENSYLEGSGENVLFGGGDPAIRDLVPSDIVITGNLIAKPVAWRRERWQVKNLLELKNARRVTIDHNTLEYNWPAAQSGFAVLFTVRNQDGRCPACQVEQVAFTDNLVRHSAGGIQILGFDNNAPSRQTRKITIRNNVLADIDSKNWGGSGYAFLLLGAPREVVIDHNTIVQDNASGLVQVEGPPILEFVFTNNLARHNAYGIIGTDHAPGSDTISAFFPGSHMTANVIADGDPRRYPMGNRFPSSEEFRRQFVSYATGDYRLVPDSPWHRAGTDGLDLGASAEAGQDPGRRDPAHPQPSKR